MLGKSAGACVLLCIGLAVGCKAEVPDGIFACKGDDKQCPDDAHFCHADGFCYHARESTHAASHQLDAGAGHADGGPDAATQRDRDSGPIAKDGDTAVHSPGDACDDDTQSACGDFDSRTTLACMGGAWTPADTCNAGQRCDTRSGATEGQCVDLVPECVDKQANDEFCRGNDRMTCGRDRVSASAQPCPDGNVCVLNDGHASCTPDADECAMDEDDCDDEPDACVNVLDTFECRCPRYYMGSGRGAHGCADELECDTDNGGCDTHPKATCNEVVGGPRTCSCPSGYRGKGIGSQGCVDRDECADGAVAACGAGATDCTNTEGGYRCVCDAFSVPAADERSCGERAWSAPVRIDETHDTGDALGPQAALDVSGNASVVWQQNDGTLGSIWANRYAAGGDWDTAKPIESEGTDTAVQPSVAVDGDGNVIALWVQKGGASGVGYSVWANRYAIGHGWGTPGMVTSGYDDDTAKSTCKVVMNAAGSGIAMWSFYDTGYYDTWSSRYTAGNWSAPVRASSGAYGTDVVLDEAGNAIILLAVNDGVSADHTRATRSVGNGAWDSPAAQLESKDIAEDKRSSDRTMGLAIDGSGNATAVWYQTTKSPSDETTVAIWTNRYVPGVGWGNAATISTNAENSVAGPAIAVDAQGDAIAAWPQSNGTHKRIFASRQPADQSWLTPGPIDMSSGGDASEPHVAMDASGNTIVLWQQSDGTHVHIWANRYVVGNGWDAAVRLDVDNDAYDTAQPALSVNASGKAIAVWQQSDGTHNYIWASRFE